MVIALALAHVARFTLEIERLPSRVGKFATEKSLHTWLSAKRLKERLFNLNQML